MRIEEHTGGFRVTLAIRGGTTHGAEKVLVLPTCDEAVDAAVVVLAFAFARESEPTDRSEAPAASNQELVPNPVTASADLASRAETSGALSRSPKRPAPLLAVVSTNERVDDGPGPSAPIHEPDRPSSRASLAAGVDMGTLPSPTLTVSGALARSFSAFELSGAVRYGLPTESENVENGVSESVRRDFGAVELAACYGIGVRVRLAACGGAEVGVVRSTRQSSGPGVDVDEDAAHPRVAGIFGARVSHRAGSIQPELELSGVAVALGRQPDASLLALRVAAGAAVEF